MKRTVKEIEQLLLTLDETHPLFQEIACDERKSVQKLLARWRKQKENAEKERVQWEQMSQYEQSLYTKGITSIAGIDEAGRGPLAGPVVAAAVILPQDAYLPGLNDSKKLSEAKRETLFTQIQATAISIGVGIVSAKEIDELNIYQAAKKAMVQAVEQLTPKPEYLLIDAMELPLAIPQQSLIKGDANSVSIAAASVVAKVTRDTIMKQLGAQYPQYGFEKHMGYGTEYHLQAIRTYGVTEHHRRSFSPVRELV
ncbi:ribonuclease HII [Anoxybacillus voinovskiensis]|uniref:Ribonuclease HII n=1 Tax=Anoxybacteroides voinovskiense TaxID=230470 RepID=A0A840DU26_9BACL|nr:ribonuclease HII [Anoxybacillus voinovskiensis]MBB4072636.1 ribonuclease HII [Anoxybacillus voinovskiensis]GGJ55819.1 ribonuclease HII [Anoxybacillus voinovskiensis]